MLSAARGCVRRGRGAGRSGAKGGCALVPPGRVDACRRPKLYTAPKNTLERTICVYAMFKHKATICLVVLYAYFVLHLGGTKWNKQDMFVTNM